MSSSRTVNDNLAPVSELSILRKLCSINRTKTKGSTRTGQYPRTALKGERRPFDPTYHGHPEYLFSRKPAALTWKEADIVPVSKQRPIQDVNEHLHPISLTPLLRKTARDYVVHDSVVPAVRKKIKKSNRGQYPNHALRTRLLAWSITGTSTLMGTRPRLELISVGLSISLITISWCVNFQIKIFRTTSYAGLLTFDKWIGDRGLNWSRIASPNGVTSQLVPLRGQR